MLLQTPAVPDRSPPHPARPSPSVHTRLLTRCSDCWALGVPVLPLPAGKRTFLCFLPGQQRAQEGAGMTCLPCHLEPKVQMAYFSILAVRLRILDWNNPVSSKLTE